MKGFGANNSIRLHHFLRDRGLQCYPGLARRMNCIKLGEDEHIGECRRGCIGLEQQSTVVDMKYICVACQSY